MEAVYHTTQLVEIRALVMSSSHIVGRLVAIAARAERAVAV